MSSDICVTDVLCSLRVLSFIDSSHFPVSLTLYCQNYISAPDVPKPKWISKIIWNQSMESIFLEKWNSVVLQDMIAKALTAVELDINIAIRLFTEALLSASECMIKRVVVGEERPRQPALWFDGECKSAKTITRQCLNDFRRSRLDVDRELYVEARKQYKALTKNKKMSFNRNKALHLASHERNSKMFWKEIKQLSVKKKLDVSKDITDTQWLDHFQQLFNVNIIAQDDGMGASEPTKVREVTDDLCAELNAAITEYEVLEAIHNLKKGKACGTDKVLAEMLKLIDKLAITFLTTLFNNLFNNGIYPDEWSKAIIVPIFKKGDPTLVANYRGVSLLSLISKCYTYILNKRLVKWTEEHKHLTESQAGFRSGYSTTDHIFTLKAIIDKCFAKKNGKLYVCFVDLRQAFDSVQRKPLFDILIKYGINGKFMKAITAMYSSVLSCVRTGNGLTEFFDCPAGLRQGCVLSPELFSLFINEIALSVDKGGKHGIQFLPGLVELFILLFADDIALLSATALGLQNQINIMSEACKRLFLNINIDKTKIMIFRKGGFLGKYEKWYLNGKPLEVVNEYNYLGFVFTTKMSLKRGVDALVVKGRRACIDCIRYLKKLSDISKKSFFKIFDSQVQSVLLYSSEVWGLQMLSNIEKVHTLAIKRFLNVPLKVSNKLVYGEVGRYPLYVNSSVRCIKYWLKLISLDFSRLPKQAYIMLKNLDERGKTCWVTHVKNTLFSLGFGFVWLQQGVGCEKSFISIFKQRMSDIYMQEWYGSIDKKEMYKNYSLFKSVFKCEEYFDFVDKKCFRDCLIKLRLGTLPIGASCFKRTFSRDSNNLCKCCNVMEDENHFVFKCTLYDSHRIKYLNLNYSSYTDIIRNGNIFEIRRLSIYLFVSLKTRLEYVDSGASDD